MRLSRNLLTFLLPCAVAITATPLWAAENVEEKAAKAGMPQLDMQFYPSQIFWLAITFAILYFLMKRFALPGIERTQHKRHELISAELAAANAANEQAKAMIAQYEKALVDARAEAQAAVIDITTKAAKTSLARQAEQQQVLNKRMQEAEAAIASAREAALVEAKATATEIANAALEKITGMKLQVTQ